MCLTSDKPIEIKVVTDKPLIFYKILQKKQSTSTVQSWVTPHRRETVFLDVITKKNDGPGLPIKFTIGAPVYMIEEGLHGFVRYENALEMAIDFGSFRHKVFEMELPVGTNYAIGWDNHSNRIRAVVADRAIYREIEVVKPKVKKYEVVYTNVSKELEYCYNITTRFDTEQEARNFIDSMFDINSTFGIREVEVEDE